MSGGDCIARSPSSWTAGIRRLWVKRSKWSRDSQKSMTPQPSSIGPAEWKIRPSGGSVCTFM
jgi:hypothetical protein